VAETWFYHLATRSVDLATRLATTRTVVGLENVPSAGPVLLVANHIGLVDPALIGAVSPRPVHWMAKEELFRNPILRWVITQYHAFPVRRGEGDRQAYQTTVRLLRQGEIVGMFPEGTRSRDGALRRAHPGAAAIAARSGATVLPVAVWGTEQIFRWPRRSLRPAVHMVVGKPFSLSADVGGAKDELLAQHTEQIMQAIAQLLPAAYRGYYAGVPGDREPSLR
jgi:1-acyl-sn-glycerol-3-phosphate acyltransferase